jgi:hypothetical protein
VDKTSLILDAQQINKIPNKPKSTAIFEKRDEYTFAEL